MKHVSAAARILTATIASLAVSSGVLFAQEPETVITPEDLAQEEV